MNNFLPQKIHMRKLLMFLKVLIWWVSALDFFRNDLQNYDTLSKLIY